jgi:hypothetical protein
MKESRYQPEEELIEKATTILLSQLGPAEALRFLTLPRRTRMESVARHRAWQQDLDKDTFFDEVFGEKM